MEIRKLLIGALSASMIAIPAVVTAEEINPISNDIAVIAEEMRNYSTASMVMGEFISYEDNQLLLKGESEFIINIDEKSIIMDTETNSLDLSELKEGMEIYVVASNAQTRSLPPQQYGYYIMAKTKDEAKVPLFVEVAKVEKDEKGTYNILSTDGMYNAKVTDKTEFTMYKTKNIITPDELTEGSKLLVYSDIMTMSIPAHLPSQKIVVMDIGAKVDSESSELTVLDKIIVNGNDIDAKVIVDENTVMVPVRKVAEALGLEVQWDEELQAVSVGTIQMGINFRIGEDSYNKAKMAPTVLGAAPALIDDLTYVPLTLFDELIGSDVSYTDGIINIK